MAAGESAGRDILDKLGIRRGHAVALVGVEPALADRIMDRAGQAEPQNGLLDIVIVATRPPDDATEILRRWRPHLRPNGGIWPFTGKRGQPSYVDQRALIEAGARAGLVDNKVCSVSDEIGAMRFVIRRKDRPAP